MDRAGNLGQQGPTGQDRVLVRQAAVGYPDDGLASARFLAANPGRDLVTATTLTCQPSCAAPVERFSLTVLVH